MVLLTQTGLVKVQKLSESRGYVLIGIFVVAAILAAALWPDTLEVDVVPVARGAVAEVRAAGWLS